LNDAFCELHEPVTATFLNFNDLRMAQNSLGFSDEFVKYERGLGAFSAY
jgi:hypothetical protein